MHYQRYSIVPTFRGCVSPQTEKSDATDHTIIVGTKVRTLLHVHNTRTYLVISGGIVPESRFLGRCSAFRLASIPMDAGSVPDTPNPVKSLQSTRITVNESGCIFLLVFLGGLVKI
jgi:hypothetical protein